MFKNCILITIDSLRADHLKLYGYKNIETPNIEELSSNGIIFKNAYANSPGTPSSFPAILTSTYPMMYGGYGKLSKHRPYLPHILKKNGMYTIGISSNPYLSRYFGYNKGFDFFYDGLSSEKNKIINIIKKGIDLIKYYLGHPPYTAWYSLNKIAKELIENLKNKRFFMWIHYMDVHLPYLYKNKLKNILYRKKINMINSLVTEVSQGKNKEVDEDLLFDIIELYDEGIKRVDDAVGDLLNFLERMKIKEDTLIILTSDHGEEFMEHGGLCHMPKLYDELLHIPLIISNPSLNKKCVSVLVDQLDIAPTISNALGFNIDQKWLGRSLLNRDINDKVIVSEVSNSHTSAKVNKKEWRISVRTKKWKLHYHIANNRFELYDVSNDPVEKNNLAENKNDVIEELMPIINNHIGSVRKTTPLEDQDIKKAIKNLKLKGKI